MVATLRDVRPMGSTGISDRDGGVFRMARPKITAEAAMGRLHSYMSERTVKMADGCWEWTGPFDDNGYGMCRMGLGSKGRATQTTAHRMAYSLRYPEIDINGLVVRHLCNNVKCVNPEHLLHGTHADNVQDRVDAGRSATGERNGRSVLNERSVLAIKRSLMAGAKQSDLAVLAGVSDRAINLIASGKNWKHVVLSDSKGAVAP